MKYATGDNFESTFYTTIHYFSGSRLLFTSCKDGIKDSNDFHPRTHPHARRDSLTDKTMYPLNG